MDEIGAGSSSAVWFAVRVNGSVPAGAETVLNSVAIDDDGENGRDPNDADNASSVTTALNAAPNLQITKSDGDVTLQAGQVVIYTLNYMNAGNQASSGVVILEAVPAHTTFDAANSTPGWGIAEGAVGGTIGQMHLGTVAAGQSGTVFFAVRTENPLTVKQVVNTASISDDGVSGDDSDPNDNTATAITETGPNLKITKTSNTVRVRGNDVVVYNLECQNIGGQAVSNITVTETIPQGCTFEAASSASGWTFANGAPAGTVGTFAIGSLAVGATQNVAFAIRMSNPVPSGMLEVVNVATISDAQKLDTVAEDNISTKTIPLGQYHSAKRVMFEDMNGSSQAFNDFDYNDLVLRTDAVETYNDQDQLTQIALNVVGFARGATYDHDALLDLGIGGSARINVKKFSSTGTEISNANFTHNGAAPARGINLIASTKAMMPNFGQGAYPFTTNTDPLQGTVGHSAFSGLPIQVTVSIDTPESNPRVFDNPGTPGIDEHEMALYGYHVHVTETGANIYRGWDYNTGTQDIVVASQYAGFALAGFPLDQAIAMPLNAKHPIEAKRIWKGYRDFTNYIYSGKMMNLNWAMGAVVNSNLWPLGSIPATAIEKTAVLADAKVKSGIIGSPVSADLNGDGKRELVIGRCLNLIQVYDASGALLNTIDPFTDSYADSQCSPVLFDLDGDKKIEILRGYDNGKLIITHADATPYLAGSIKVDGTIKGTPAVADIDLDGKPEIIIQSGSNKIYAYDYMLKLKQGFPLDLGGTIDQGGHCFLTPSPVLANIRNDDKLEIIATSLAGKVYVINSGGTILSGWPVDLGSPVLSSPAVGDLDKDGSLEVVLSMYENGNVIALDKNGKTKPGWPVSRRQGSVSSPMLTDCDGDGKLEVFVGSMDAQIYGFSASGKPLKNFPVLTSGSVHASPFTADTNGDGKFEMVCGSDDGKIYAAGKGLSPVGLSAAKSIIVTAGAVNDFNGDGKLELAFGSHDGQLYILSLPTNLTGKTAVWNGFRGNTRNTGAVLSYSASTGVRRGWEAYR